VNQTGRDIFQIHHFLKLVLRKYPKYESANFSSRYTLRYLTIVFGVCLNLNYRYSALREDFISSEPGLERFKIFINTITKRLQRQIKIQQMSIICKMKNLLLCNNKLGLSRIFIYASTKLVQKMKIFTSGNLFSVLWRLVRHVAYSHTSKVQTHTVIL